MRNKENKNNQKKQKFILQKKPRLKLNFNVMFGISNNFLKKNQLDYKVNN